MLCPYCGSLSTQMKACSHCGGHFDLLSRQRTQNAMGPWFIRDQIKPFHPGCSYATLRRLALRGRIRFDTIMRGPTTRQFWSFARNTPGVAHLLGLCHACGAQADANQDRCKKCDVSFLLSGERQHLGLAPIHLLPGDAEADAIADAAFGSSVPAASPSAQPPAANSNTVAHENHAASVHHAAMDPSPDAATELSPVAPGPVSGRGRRRRKSWLPLTIVGGSVALAAGVISVIVIVSSKPPVGPDGNQAEAVSGLPVSSEVQSMDGRTADTQPEPAGPEVEPALDSESPSVVPTGSVPDGPTEPIPTAPDERSQPASTPAEPQFNQVEASLRSIATQTPDELRATLNRWQADPDTPKAWLEAVNRRIEQLRLREKFGA